MHEAYCSCFSHIIHKRIMSQLFKRYSIVVLHTINYAHIYEKCGLNNKIQNLALRGEVYFY
jgi:hypothetical protein